MKKKISVITAALLCCAMLAGCGSSNSSSGSASVSDSESVTAKTPAEKTAELLGAVEFPSMVEVSADDLSARYSFGPDKVSSFSAYVCGSGAMPDEFGVFEAADETSAAEIKTALESRIENQKELYTDYTPAEMYKFDGYLLRQDGTTVAYAICADNTAAEDILG